jgi:hypothetical protein
VPSLSIDHVRRLQRIRLVAGDHPEPTQLQDPRTCTLCDARGLRDPGPEDLPSAGPVLCLHRAAPARLNVAEAVDYVAGYAIEPERGAEHRHAGDPVLLRLASWLLDRLPGSDASVLLPFVSVMVLRWLSSNAGMDRQRATGAYRTMLTDWMVRDYLPEWLDLAEPTTLDRESAARYRQRFGDAARRLPPLAFDPERPGDYSPSLIGAYVQTVTLTGSEVRQRRGDAWGHAGGTWQMLDAARPDDRRPEDLAALLRLVDAAAAAAAGRAVADSLPLTGPDVLHPPLLATIAEVATDAARLAVSIVAVTTARDTFVRLATPHGAAAHQRIAADVDRACTAALSTSTRIHQLRALGLLGVLCEVDPDLHRADPRQRARLDAAAVRAAALDAAAEQ